jgi:hypothetical protein
MTPNLPGRSPGVPSSTQNGDRSGSAYSRNAKDYERYLALARAETQIGNTVDAENYYQHAEHYFRSMRSGPEET